MEGFPKSNTTEQAHESKNPPIKYTEVVIDDAYMEKNLLPNGALRMTGGRATWNGEVELMKYTLSENLSPEYRDLAADKIEKLHAGQEKTYRHEAHHIHNRENALTPHVAAETLREFLAFRVLDELSAFTAGELEKPENTPEGIISALRFAKQKILDSYYGDSFTNEAQWYISQHGKTNEILSRTINTERYHQVMRQYFTIQNQDILSIIQKNNSMPEFTDIVNELIKALDPILEKAGE